MEGLGIVRYMQVCEAAFRMLPTEGIARLANIFIGVLLW